MTEVGQADGPDVLVERSGAVAIITLNRPEQRNALDSASSLALTYALREFEQDPDAHVGVLAGGGGHFCAGADLKAVANGEIFDPWGAGENGPCRDQLSKPLIAAVEGHACGGGLGLALRCDLRVAATSSRFAVLSRRWGVPVSDGTAVRLPKLVGMGRALDLLLTAREVPGPEAVAIGLADRVVDDGRALEEAVALAERIAVFPQAAMLADRKSTYEAFSLPTAQGLMREAEISRAARLDSPAGATRFANGAGRHGVLGE
ncbi:crotonase/enoyl-CoA hydratase family protein [Pseudonocardia yunnanensis]|uniref:Crotonase/enoyl-CoA hydratase family protein n=1 Tax=Pseudonocardia yunnanensis TaxID=58107 RepID=A0ABW4F6B1_9PSEU